MSPNDADRFDDPLDGRTVTSLEAMVNQFRGAWQLGHRPDLATYLPDEPVSEHRPLLEALVAVDLRERIRRGEMVRIEAYMERFSQLGSISDLSIKLIATEYQARRELAEPVSYEEYQRRFPAQAIKMATELGRTVNVLESGEGPPPSLELVPGDVAGDFQIVKLLGQGRFATVYLARQQSLDRLVALKISPKLGDEGKALAKLEHPNIVQVYGEQVVGSRNLLAMRYVPGKSLDRWLEYRSVIDRRHFRGRDFLLWVSRIGGEVPTEFDGELDSSFSELRWTATHCRLVLGLARALKHAHGRDVVHRDVKPANVLVSFSGEALLMDFNVATRTRPGLPSEEGPFGGTLAYMAPEHLRALQSRQPDAIAEVDARSDIYSLGIVFFELLSGCHPWPQPATFKTSLATMRELMALRLRGAAPLPRGIPGASPAVRSIVRKCLAPLPTDRYQSAGELVEDLERLLSDRALAVAPDPSPGERAIKWLRRHPRTVTFLVAVVVAAAGGVVFASWLDLNRLIQAEALLRQAASAGEQSTHALAWETIRKNRGLLWEKISEAGSKLRESNVILPEGLTALRKRQAIGVHEHLVRRNAIRELRDFESMVEGRRAVAGARAEVSQAVHDPLEVYRVLERSDWEMLPQFRALSLENRQQVSRDITEILLIRTLARQEARRKIAEDSQFADGDIQELSFLSAIPQSYQRHGLIEAVRRSLTDRDTSTVVDTAWLVRSAGDEFGHYLAGVIAAQRGDFALAVAQFEICLAEPSYGASSDLWPRFLRAFCCERLGRIQEAITDYGRCLGMRKNFVWADHNLGLIHTTQGRYELAIKHFSEAIRHNPNLGQLHANLGVALFRNKQFTEALGAFDRAISAGFFQAEVYANRAAAHVALGDPSDARQDLEKALSIDPDSRAAQENLKRLEAVNQP